MESKKHGRRHVLHLIALLAVGAALVGCGPAPTPETVEVIVTVAGEEVVVTQEVEVTREVEVEREVVTEVTVPPETTFEFWLPDSVRWHCLRDNMISEFNTNSPTVEAEVKLLANYGVDSPAFTAVMGGAGPDLFQADMIVANDLGLGGFVLPLNDMIDEKGWDELYPAWVLETVTAADGNIYSMPVEMETLVLYYNKTVFEANGWTPPDTMDEWFALCEEIEAAGLIPIASKNSTWWQLGEFLNYAGPENVYKALTGQLPWTDAVFVDAISVYNEMMQNGWFMGSVETMMAADNETYLGAFASGDAPMLISGTWFKGQEGDYFGPDSGNPNEWAWVPFPTKTGEDIYSVGFGSAYAINKSSDKLGAVAEYLDWYISPEVQGQQFGQCITPPAPIAVTEEMMEGADPRMIDIYAAVGQAFEQGNYGYTLWTFYPPDSVTWITKEIEKVWYGQMTVEEYLAGLDELFQEELAEGKVPAVPSR